MATIEVQIVTGFWAGVFYMHRFGESPGTAVNVSYCAGAAEDGGGFAGSLLPNAVGGIPFIGVAAGGAPYPGPDTVKVVVVLPDGTDPGFITGITVPLLGDLGAPTLSGVNMYGEFGSSPMPGVAWLWETGGFTNPFGDPFSAGNITTATIAYDGETPAFWTDFQSAYELL